MIEFSGYKWRTQQPWGDYHSDDSFWWYDPECVDVTDGILRLQTKHHERKIDDEVINEIGVGLVSSETPFTYGTFEADVMLPMGTGLFPAFWLYAVDTWPPEIDIFEGWSRKSGLYTSNYIPYYSLASNVHYDVSPNNKSIKSKSHMTWKRFDREYLNFKLIWTPNEISIYYNNKLVRQVTDSNILKWFKDIKMWVIFNNGVENEEDYTNDSVMLVKNFKYKSI
jgi:beta-glucanase (GH16 family)